MATVTRRLLLFILIRRRINRRKTLRCWVRRIFKERRDKGEYLNLVEEAKLFDHQMFFVMFRMLPTKFEELLALMAPKIAEYRAKREPIGPEERLFITLRYLVTRDAFCTIWACYRVSKSAIGRIVKKPVRQYGIN